MEYTDTPHWYSEEKEVFFRGLRLAIASMEAACCLPRGPLLAVGAANALLQFMLKLLFIDGASNAILLLVAYFCFIMKPLKGLKRLFWLFVCI